MLKKFSYFFMALGLAMASACSTDEPNVIEENNQEPNVPVTPDVPDTPDVDPVPDTPADVKLPPLFVQGRYVKNIDGAVVNLHGVTQTPKPYFNSMAWNNYDVNGCLAYNKRMVDGIIAAGWKMNFVRLHLDPYWSDDPSMTEVRYEGHERFSSSRFKKYLDEVFIPMAEYFIDNGFYVVMRPPGVCPENLAIGDSYHQFLKTVWRIISTHSKIKNNTDIMFELANEPINMSDGNGNYSNGWLEGSEKNCTAFFQEVIDVIRENATDNIIWVPGLCWQQHYSGYVKYPIKDTNYGFAIHCYPGWYGSDSEGSTGEGGGDATAGYANFQAGWNSNIGGVAKEHPIMVTEIDWAPKVYDHTWGKGITGVAGGKGFGANFKKIADDSGNVSWLYFTTTLEDLCNFRDVEGTPGNYTFLNDPEACCWAMYHWFAEYAAQ